MHSLKIKYKIFKKLKKYSTYPKMATLFNAKAFVASSAVRNSTNA